MCDLCRKNPCDCRCPNAEQLREKYICAVCAESERRSGAKDKRRIRTKSERAAEEVKQELKQEFKQEFKQAQEEFPCGMIA